jgi:hypothetical protein
MNHEDRPNDRLPTKLPLSFFISVAWSIFWRVFALSVLIGALVGFLVGFCMGFLGYSGEVIGRTTVIVMLWMNPPLGFILLTLMIRRAFTLVYRGRYRIIVSAQDSRGS